MDFDLSDEQRLLKDSVDRLIADQYGFEQRRAYAKKPEGYDPALWSQYAELGLLGLIVPENNGGAGAGPIETMIVMEAFGRGLILEPYFATAVLGGALIRHAASPEQQNALLPKLAEGSLKLAFAQMERQSRYDLADVTTCAAQSGMAWKIDGAKSLVLHGEAADKLLVTARVSGNQHDRDGIGLFVVDAKASGVTRRAYATQDGSRAVEITFDAAPAERLGPTANALPAIERAIDEATAALCAEAVGAMTTAHTMTVDYLKTRKQFGRAIGEFQALQHRAVDMYVHLEQARSMAIFAAMMAGSDDAAERHRAVAAAKSQIGKSGRALAKEAVQLHGGIGVTMEYAVGHYLKRLTGIDMTFGDADWHLADVARAGGLIGTEREPV
ncbi:MAG TPA: acyl-CoA dehydrogenase family protein [Magnetospirillaceae bacterium]